MPKGHQVLKFVLVDFDEHWRRSFPGALGGNVAYEALFVLGYFLWEQRFAILLSFGLLFALVYVTAWLFRPFGRVLHLWMPWIFLFRLIRKRF